MRYLLYRWHNCAQQRHEILHSFLDNRLMPCSGQTDLWTMTESGCACAPEGRGGGGGRTCACCAPGGCPCQGAGVNRCVQCGLEAACGSGQLSIFGYSLAFLKLICKFLTFSPSYGFILTVSQRHQNEFNTKNNIFCISFLHFYIYATIFMILCKFFYSLCFDYLCEYQSGGKSVYILLFYNIKMDI